MVDEQTAVRVSLPEPIEVAVNGFPARMVALSSTSAKVEHEQRLPLESPRIRMTWRGGKLDVPVSIPRSEIVARRGASLLYRSEIQFSANEAAQELIASILRWAQSESSEESLESLPEIGIEMPAGDIAIDPSGETLPEFAIEPPAEDIAIDLSGETLPEIAIEPPVEDIAIDLSGETLPEIAIEPPAREKPAERAAAAPPPKPSRSLEDSWTRQVAFLKRDPEEDLPFAQFRLTDSGWVKENVASPAQPEDGFTIRSDDHDFAELQKTFEFADEDTRRMMRVALESKLAK